MLYSKKLFNEHFNNKGKNWYKNIKNIIPYFKSIHFLIKNGYSDEAIYDTVDWFNDVTRDVLQWHLDVCLGSPVVIDHYDINDIISVAENNAEWQNILREMLDLLNKMQSKNYNTEEYKECDDDTIHKFVIEAKDKFFKLYGRYYYCLWSARDGEF